MPIEVLGKDKAMADTTTRLKKVLDVIVSVIKIAGIVILGVILGRFLWDFTRTKKEIEAEIKGGDVRWERSDDDPEKETVKSPLSESEIDKKIAQVQRERKQRKRGKRGRR